MNKKDGEMMQLSQSSTCTTRGVVLYRITNGGDPAMAGAADALNCKSYA